MHLVQRIRTQALTLVLMVSIFPGAYSAYAGCCAVAGGGTGTTGGGQPPECAEPFKTCPKDEVCGCTWCSGWTKCDPQTSKVKCDVFASVYNPLTGKCQPGTKTGTVDITIQDDYVDGDPCQVV